MGHAQRLSDRFRLLKISIRLLPLLRDLMDHFLTGRLGKAYKDRNTPEGRSILSVKASIPPTTSYSVRHQLQTTMLAS